MATRVMTTGRLLSDVTYRVVESVATWSPSDFLDRASRFLWPQYLTTLQCLLRLAWLPFWIDSDLPAPQFRPKPAPFAGTTDSALRLRSLLRGTRNRQLVNRLATLVMRAITITILVACVWSILALVGGAGFERITVLRVFGVSLGLALAFAWHYRPTLRDTARMLDQSFALSDRMTTAYDVAAARPGNRDRSPNIAFLQVVEATNTLAMLEKHPILRMHVPWREVVLAAGLAMVLLSAHLLNGTGTAIEPLGQARVPAFVAASDRLQQQALIPDESTLPELYKPSVAEVQERADLSAAAEHDLLQIADALEDNPLTSAIADAIRSGDYQRASDLLRAVAPELANMSPEERDTLAGQLDTAADAMSGEHPGLRQTTERAADGLRSEPEQAEESINDLSESIDTAGNEVADQGELAEQMRDARESEETGSVQDSSGSRPDSGDSESAGESPESNSAGEGSDAAGGQQTDGSGESSQSGESSESNGESSDQGSEAEPGESESSSSSGSQSPDSSGSGTGSSASGESQSGEDASSAGSGSGSVDGSNDQVDGSSSGTSGDTQATGGSGAGTGEGENTGKNSSDGTESRPGTGSGETPDPNVTDGSGTGTTTDSLGEEPTGSSITLSRAPGTEGQRTGGSSTSSTGSGAGVAAGSGGTDQGDVGTAGPDSTRVPQEYRPIVEDYFSDGP